MGLGVRRSNVATTTARGVCGTARAGPAQNAACDEYSSGRLSGDRLSGMVIRLLAFGAAPVRNGRESAQGPEAVQVRELVRDREVA